MKLFGRERVHRVADVDACLQLCIQDLVFPPEGRKMKISSKILVVAAVTIAMFMIAGCPTQTTVDKIQQDPHHFYNKEVALRGNVTESYGALGTGVYQLDDGTGKIWILSENYGVPSKGAHVTVTGDVVETISFAGKSFSTALKQTRHRD